MVSASVGFQCPSCVKEGNAGVRQARTTYGGLIPSGWSISVVLVAINVAIWLLIQVTGGDVSRLTEWLALLPRGICDLSPTTWAPMPAASCQANGATWVPGVSDGAVWRMVTSMFTHVEPLHVFFNMYTLWVLGPQVEAALGRARFLALYLLAGLAGSVTVLWLSEPYGSTVGASGAIFGLLGALLVIVLHRGLPAQSLLFWIGINLVFTFVAPNISWQGHLGGLAGGAALTAAFVYIPRGPRREQLQWAAAGVFAAVLVVLTVVRALALGA